MTFYHVFEDMVAFPIPVYCQALQSARVLIEGVENKIWTKVHDPEIAQFRIDHDDRMKHAVAGRLLEMGFLRLGQVGDGPSYSIKAKHLMTGLERMLDAGFTIYNTERMSREGFAIPTALSVKI